MMFTPNALKVLSKRYLTKALDGKPLETVEDMFRRVAKAIASAEDVFSKSKQKSSELEEKFFQMMLDQDFLPNSPTLMNAGKPLGQLSACFVLPIEDSMEGIFGSIMNAALIHKSGGGTGFSFSRLRPANDVVASTNGVSSGPISFMKVFNVATETIKQGGTRRGANMGILRVDHPDIIEFIRSKENNDELTNFNISVAITNQFMDAVSKNEEYDLINPRTKKAVKKLKALDVFQMIIENSWKNGEPGIIFLDRLNKDNPTPTIGEIESTNPCGEQPLLPYESCNLGSINLGKFLAPPNSPHRIDHARLKEVIKLAVRFLDNVIEVNKYPIPQIDEMTRANRKIGLGIMGWSDLLIKMNVPYNSEEALSIAEEFMQFFSREAWLASAELAEERGPFPNYKTSIIAARGGAPVRNATVTTIAPTGTISIIGNCSSGIEPMFAVAYEKHVLDGEKLIEVNPLFLEKAQNEGFLNDQILEKIASLGTISKIPEIPDFFRKLFVCSHDISPEWHVRMQGAFQKYTDNAVSKTVNFPFTATKKDVERVFILAHTLGCKGITVYRDGSRDVQVLNLGQKGQKKIQNTGYTISPRPRPGLTQGTTEKVKIGCGNLYVTVNSDEKGICEIFTSLGRGGGCPSQSEATARLVSMALRTGIDVEELIAQLKGIRCLSTLKRASGTEGVRVLSCPDAIGRAIERFYLTHEKSLPGSADGNQVNQRKQEDQKKQQNQVERPDSSRTWVADNENYDRICPDCGESLRHEGGCVICSDCGYSKCG
ncbi:MAG: vitamin B12-dependent ribonucleotide reductase [Candidatus Riflebacteria bacterium]|nr:vitamin B12-dependent ribonucleotide reductase [Candidatus Riflebacteria bacterium]